MVSSTGSFPQPEFFLTFRFQLASKITVDDPGLKRPLEEDDFSNPAKRVNVNGTMDGMQMSEQWSVPDQMVGLSKYSLSRR